MVGAASTKPRRFSSTGWDGSGQWRQWYRDAIPAAEALYEQYMKEQG